MKDLEGAVQDQRKEVLDVLEVGPGREDQGIQEVSLKTGNLEANQETGGREGTIEPTRAHEVGLAATLEERGELIALNEQIRRIPG